MCGSLFSKCKQIKCFQKKQRVGLKFFQKQPILPFYEWNQTTINTYIILLITFGEKCSHRQTRKALVIGSPITNLQIIFPVLPNKNCFVINVIEWSNVSKTYWYFEPSLFTFLNILSLCKTISKTKLHNWTDSIIVHANLCTYLLCFDCQLQTYFEIQ